MNQSIKKCFEPLRVFALAALLSTFSIEGMGMEDGSSSSSTSTESDGTGFDDNVNDVPVDGGISLLLLAGLAYGVRSGRKRR
jgi:hypothetical protein